MKVTHPIPRMLGNLLWLLFISLIIFYSAMRPNVFWDSIAYVGASYEYIYSDPDVIHRKTYENLENFVKPADFAELTSGKFREGAFASSTAFLNQIPFYRSRALLTYPGSILIRFGVHPFRAIVIVSMLFGILSIFIIKVLFGDMVQDNGNFYSLISLFLFLYFCGLVDGARSAGTGTVSVFFIVFLAYLACRGSYSVFSVGPISLLGREDLIIYAILIYLYLLYSKKFHPITILANVIVIVAFYLTMTYYFDSYSYSILMHYTFVEFSLKPSEINADELTLWWYAENLIKRTWYDLLNRSAFLVTTIMALCLIDSVACNRKSGIVKGKSETFNLFVSLNYIYIIVHFGLFPIARGFTGCYVLIFLQFLAIWFARTNEDLGSQGLRSR